MTSPVAAASVESAAKARPEKAPVTAHALSPEVKRAIIDVVKNWVAAWAAKDVEKYLASYAPDFKPANGMSHKAWDAQRRERVRKSKSIAVDSSEIAVDEAGEKTVNVSFVQVYRSDVYKDTTKKTLKLKKIDDKWLIVSEQASKQ
jgi:murein L,D-transpeptidase YafK